MNRASLWFNDEQAFQKLCSDAAAAATDEQSQKLAAHLVEASTTKGLQTFLTEQELQTICALVGIEMPKRIQA